MNTIDKTIYASMKENGSTVRMAWSPDREVDLNQRRLSRVEVYDGDEIIFRNSLWE